MMDRKLKRKKYLQEIVIFISMFILTMLHEWMSINTPMSFIKGLTFFVLIYFQAQFHRFFIFPLFLKKRTLEYLCLTLLTTMLGAAVLFTCNRLWLQPDCFLEESLVWNYIYHFVICIISTFTIMSLSLMQRYALELQKRNSDQLLLNEMNLRFLHTQLNPHFFFNMLNNLYGVTLTEAERAPNLIIKLSNLMRYQIENAASSHVRLDQEINYIKNYVELERERIGKRCEIVLKEDHGDTSYLRYRIAPLILIVLIENAFKHSVNKQYWFVHISICVKQGILHLDIRNSPPKDSSGDDSTGIGLTNIRERLALIYRERFELDAEEFKEYYHTQLRIKLDGE